MNFIEAVRKAKEGKRVYRKEGREMYENNGNIYLQELYMGRRITSHLEVDDILSEDWVVE